MKSMRALLAVLTLTVAAASFASAQFFSDDIPNGCDAEYIDLIASKYVDDRDCGLLLTDIVTNAERGACTEADKKAVGDCLLKYSAAWLEFEQNCLTSSPGAEGPSLDAASASGESPAAGEAPESEPMIEPEVMTETVTTPARKLLKMLAQKDSAGSFAQRTLLSTSEETCLSVLETEGFSAFADLTKNAASAVQMSALAVAGSFLLGMMLL